MHDLSGRVTGGGVIVGREALQRREDAGLAPYAVHSARSQGRRYPETEDRYRTPFQRDRDRIVHSSAYRRLGNKTQVFISFEGEHYRTRLTHTEEATQIAVTVARALAANEDLTEAISRAHDLGHAPFGHAGEDALAAKMVAHGGFEHNAQTLRVVEVLEQEYPAFPGLNLTWEVREGVMAHRGDAFPSLAGESAVLQPSIEAQIADVADEIAYSCHDLQDGLASGVLRREDLMREQPAWWSASLSALAATWGWDGRAWAEQPDLERRRVKGYLTNRFISDLVASSAARLEAHGTRTVDEARASGQRLVDFSPEVRAMRDELHAYLLAHLYRHHEVVTMAQKARRLLSDIFDAYCTNPDQLPAHVLARIGPDLAPERAVCDHIASMTDRGAVREHRRLFDVDAQVLP